jgi:hypothetical protein
VRPPLKTKGRGWFWFHGLDAWTALDEVEPEEHPAVTPNPPRVITGEAEGGTCVRPRQDGMNLHHLCDPTSAAPFGAVGFERASSQAKCRTVRGVNAVRGALPPLGDLPAVFA